MSKGVNITSAYAILGNMQHESFLNPGQWELNQNYDPNYGFGLGQWAPATKIENYLISQGISPTQANMENYQYQLDFLLQDAGQWNTYYVDMNTGYSSYYNVTVPIYPTLADFFADVSATLQDKTAAWMVYWERPNSGTAALQTRIDNAEYWESAHVITIALLWLIAKVAQAWRDR